MSDEKNILNDGVSPTQPAFNSSVDATLMAPTHTPEITKFQQFAKQTEAQYRDLSAENAESTSSVRVGAANAMTMFSEQFNLFSKLNSNAWSTAMKYWLNINEQSSKLYFQSMNACVRACNIESKQTNENSPAN